MCHGETCSVCHYGNFRGLEMDGSKFIIYQTLDIAYVQVYFGSYQGQSLNFASLNATPLKGLHMLTCQF